MAEEQPKTPTTDDAQPALISLTPEQMEQFKAAVAFFDQFRSLVQSPKANTPPATPPPSQPATPSLAASASKEAASSPKGPEPSSKATKRSSSRPKDGKASRTRYEYERTDSGEKSIRRCRARRPAPFDPEKDPRMICHTAAHNICSKIIRGMGFRGEW